LTQRYTRAFRHGQLHESNSQAKAVKTKGKKSLQGIDFKHKEAKLNHLMFVNNKQKQKQKQKKNIFFFFIFSFLFNFQFFFNKKLERVYLLKTKRIFSLKKLRSKSRL
jgi:hypothetical protein